MVKAMTVELTTLGVPFFGMKSDMVKKRQKLEAAGGYDIVDDSLANGPRGEINEEEIMKLQKRMLELLEDLCKD